MKVVALNKDAKLIGTFDSITLAAKHLGTTYQSLNARLVNKKPYKQILFIREPEYRQHWIDGTVESLKFDTKKERDHKRALLRWNRATEEERKRYVFKMQQACREWSRNNMYKKVVCVETGVVYESIAGCARSLGIPVSTVRSKIKRGNTSNGATFKLYEDGDK